MNNTPIINLINQEIQKYSLLKHEFYQLWQEGKLERKHLAGYSKEYFQMVKCVPNMVENAMFLKNEKSLSKILESNLQDEKNHVDPWIKFANGLDVEENELINYRGANLTNEAVNELLSLSKASFVEAVAALYAFEKELPKISETKLSGLKSFYGVSDEETCEYFNIHKEVDIYHSKIWEDIIRGFSEIDRDKIIIATRRSLQAQNKLLDSVMNQYVK